MQLTRQYQKLLELDHVELELEDSALGAIAQKAIDRQIGRPGTPGGDGGDHDEDHV